MVLRYIDEDEGDIFPSPNSAKQLEEAGYRRGYAARAESSRKGSSETYEMETPSGGTSTKSMQGIESV
ncbi:cation diffusion facilitator 1 protein [Colletotrichum tofieldiae]|nr:cation diffusion facilitator 1 protein [Colletotrichum tofieldiae]